MTSDADDGDEEATAELLSFELNGQPYALYAEAVREGVRAVSVVPLPKAPAIVEGLINLRGAVAPVLDLRARFHLPAKALTPTDHMVVAAAGARVVALRVDRALDLIEVAARDVEEATKAVPDAEYVAGVVKLPDGLVLIHDLETFLSRAEAAIESGNVDVVLPLSAIAPQLIESVCNTHGAVS